jgi:hypothetical protein
MFGLEGDQTLYVMHLSTLQKTISTMVHSMGTPSINQPSLHSMEPPIPKVVHKLSLIHNKLSL